MTTVTEVDPRQVLRSEVRSHFFEFRAAEPRDGEGDGRTLEGYAAVFDAPTTIESYAGDYEEIVKRGAFRKTLRERTPVMQFDHGNDKRVGSVPIAAIEDLHEDDEGLFVRAPMFDNDVVKPVRQAIAGKAIRGMSFKFRVLQDRWVDADGKRIKDDDLADLLANPGERGPIQRQITEVQLFELGPVVFPAYDQTSVGVRGSAFDPNQVALRGVIAQFGLDVRCIKRHLQVFDADARQALAQEIAESFPELLQVLQERAVVASAEQIAAAGLDPEATTAIVADEPETSPEPVPATRESHNPEPAPTRHSAFLKEAAGWHLPDNPYRRR